MAVRNLALPELFSGEDKAHWDDWIDHFEKVAVVNNWDDATKKKWLPARLTGRAATVYRRLPDATKDDLAETKAALLERFEPASKKELYRAELQTRKKQRKEGWATYGEDLLRLAEKAYPDLPSEAQERLALNQYLTQLDSPQVAFGVRQKNPETITAAVRLTLELESYLPPPATSITNPQAIAQLETCEESKTTDCEITAAISTTARVQDPLQKILQRLDQLELDVRVARAERRSTRPRSPITCFRCQQLGHIARNCMANISTTPSQNQGNDRPPRQ